MGTEELLLNAVFYVFAIGAVAAAIGVALSPNIIRSAFALLGVLFSVAALYAFMRADFIVAAQIIIYVGGILVLIIFAVMLTHKITDVNVSNESAHGPAAVFAVLCMLVSLCVIATWMWKWDRSAPAESPAPAVVTLLGDSKPSTASVSMALLQGDGSTGVVPGGEVRSPFAILRYTVTSASARAQSAHVTLECSERIENQPKPEKRWAPWGQVRETTLALADGKGSAEERFSGLKPGRYRWIATFADEKGILVLVKHVCPTCRMEGEPRAVCSTPDCEHKGKPLVTQPWEVQGAEFTVEAGLTRPLGVALMTRYLLPFELVSVLLLAALVGAAYLARKEVKEA
jgi:NADH:ubiquinone oxidoreductase subunit 6 (subunit J)